VALLTTDTTAVVALAAAGGAGLALLVAVAAHLRVGRLRRAYGALLGDAQAADLVTVVGEHVRAVETLRGEVGGTRRDVAALQADVADAVRHVAVVRYDAFGDMGGRLSFSAALLDDAGDGLVLTSINGRQETRSYAKGVKGGDSEHTLSPEERQAVDHAVRPARGPRRGGPAGRHAAGVALGGVEATGGRPEDDLPPPGEESAVTVLGRPARRT